MSGELETVLRLVAEGRLTPDEAAPLVAALAQRGPSATRPADTSGPTRPAASARHLRIRVEERGRSVVNLRVPLNVAAAALQLVPGLAGDQADRVRDAIQAGSVGPILDVEDPDGDAVLIGLE